MALAPEPERRGDRARGRGVDEPGREAALEQNERPVQSHALAPQGAGQDGAQRRQCRGHREAEGRSDADGQAVQHLVVVAPGDEQQQNRSDQHRGLCQQRRQLSLDRQDVPGLALEGDSGHRLAKGLGEDCAQDGADQEGGGDGGPGLTAPDARLEQVEEVEGRRKHRRDRGGGREQVERCEDEQCQEPDQDRPGEGPVTAVGAGAGRGC